MLLTAILGFPAVIFTVLLGVVLLYWLFVIFGALDVHGIGGEEHAIEGVIKGGAEAAVKGATEGLAKAVSGAGTGATVMDEVAAGVTARKGKAPVTVVVSAFAAFGWFLSVVGSEATLTTESLAALPRWLTSGITLVVAVVVGFVLARIAAKPLGRFFVTHPAQTHDGLVGRVCVVSTGSVDERFGQAALDNGGAGLILQVRNGKARIGRGDRVLIVGWSEEHGAFEVEPMDDILGDDEAKRAR